MTTANVLVTRTGTGFTIDVTPCDLDPSLTLKDFTIRHAGVQVPNTDYAKTTSTTLTYTGAALPSNTQVEVRRRTPLSPVFTPRLGLRVRSQDWNAEFDRITRRAEEYDLNGVGNTGGGAGQVLNDSYGAVWNGDTVYAPTRGALYVKLETMAPLVSPGFTGVPTVPTAPGGTNTTQAASTAYVVAGLAAKADIASPSFTGNPTVPTQSQGNNSTRVANTAYVDTGLALKANIASPAFTGTPTAPTAAGGTNTTQVATTAFVVSGLGAKADIASPTLTGTPAAPTATRGTSTTQLATTAFVQQHEAWVSVLPGGWTGTWRVRRRADGNIDMEINASATNVTLAAYTQSATLLTLAAAYRPTINQILPTHVGIVGVDIAGGFIYVDTTGAIRTETRTSCTNATYNVRGTYTWSAT